LHPDSQEIYSLLSDFGVLAPERIIQGITDAAHAFQSGMYEVLDELIFQIVLVCIDDLLMYSRDLDEPLTNLERVFQKLFLFNNKLNPKRSDLRSSSLLSVVERSQPKESPVILSIWKD